MGITSNFANVATVTRASTKTDAGGWDFTNGGTVGTLTEYASGVAAIHPTAGLLVEESTTNEIRNPRLEGATVGVIGSGGSMPTYMSVDDGGGSAEVIAIGANYFDLRLNGTFTSNPYIDLEQSAQIVASTGEDWTCSLSMQIVSGDMTNLTRFEIELIERTSGGSGVNTNDSGPSIVPDGTLRRYFYSVGLSGGASTERVQPRLRLFRSGGGAADITIRIYTPQIEQKAYPTSPVLPVVSSPAATTRAADYVTLSLGAWFNEPTGTLFFEYQPNTAGVSGRVIGGFGVTFDNTIYLSASATGTRWSGAVRSGGGLSALVTPGGQSNYSVGSTYRGAIAYAQDDFAISVNGATQATDTAGNVPVSPTRFVIGGSPWSASAGNSVDGYIKDLRYWPKRLTNAELEALVGN